MSAAKPTIQAANVELRSTNGENVVTVRVPKGASLLDLARIQQQIFANPDQLGETTRTIHRFFRANALKDGLPLALRAFRPGEIKPLPAGA